MRALTIGAAGALFLIGGCATPGQLPQRLQLAVTMTGVQAVPGPGDPAMMPSKSAGNICAAFIACRPPAEHPLQYENFGALP